MILLIDIGNTNIVFGYSDTKTILKTFRLKSLSNKTADEYYLFVKSLMGTFEFDDVIIASVVPIITSALNKMFKTYYNIDAKILGPGIKTGVQLKVDDPKTVGADIICAVAGASIYYPESIILDLGTATKYIYAKNNVFMGLSISPGIAISLRAMISSTALLPNVELVCPKKVLGTNTIACMQSGVIYGAACQVDGMIDRIKEEVGNLDIPVLSTGGLSSLIAPLCKHSILEVSELTLLGLLEVYKKNVAA